MIIRLIESPFPRVSELFRDMFSRAPWNDDCSDPVVLRTYLTDISGNKNPRSPGFIYEEKLSAISPGYGFNRLRGREYKGIVACVARRLHRKGIGTAFINATERFCRNEEITSKSLNTERKTPAYEFYITNDIRETNRMSFLAKDIS